ncbi:hypothetical protein FHW96_003719 [Novosphingobium sp. SG751A]|nr:hypothetical protein [Novosphingobium sp. SG751A]
MGRIERGRAFAALLPSGGTLIPGGGFCALRPGTKMGDVA